MLSFKKWFRSGPTSRDGLTQPQREAIVDLLNYCSLVDRNIARSEVVTIDDLEFQLDWDHKTDFDYYLNKSVGAVRGVFESKDEASFLDQIKKRLSSSKSQETALILCQKLIEADSRVTSSENATLAAVKKALA